MTSTAAAYLDNYGHHNSEAVASVSGQYQRALVIPMYDEDAGCLDRVLTRLSLDDTLIIAVVNAPTDAPAEALDRTRTLLAAVKTQPNVLVLDYCTDDLLPPKQGVGLARKIGTDTALALLAAGHISDPWIYQTDADVVLPANYFTPLSGTGARVFAHEHVVAPGTSDCDKLTHAAELYDAHMRYYVDGLSQAGSPYAFPTMGSTLAVHADSYAAVRGYPRRNAGEDFHLLNKLAKVAQVQYVPEVTLQVAARPSHRVPFGTGPALQDIVMRLDEDPSGATYLSYHPASFDLLADALGYLRQLAQSEKAIPCADDRIEALLSDLKIAELRTTLHQQYPTQAQRQTMLTHWFDGLRTLRFIHEARRFFPDQPLVSSLPAFYGQVA